MNEKMTPLAAAEEELAATTRTLEASRAARASEADRLAAGRQELEELAVQLRSSAPDSKEFAATMRARAACRDRIEVFEARLAAAQDAADEAEIARAAALDVRDREKLKALEHEIAAAEAAILEWFSSDVSRPFAEKMDSLHGLAEEARVLDIALGKRAGRGPGLPLVGAARPRWLTPDANPFDAVAGWRRANSAEAHRCGFRPSRSAIPADADHPFRQGDHPGRDAAG